MENQLIRLFILVVLVFLLTSDIKDLLDTLSTTSTLGPYLSNWRPGKHPAHGTDDMDDRTTNSRSEKKRSIRGGKAAPVKRNNNLEDKEDELDPSLKFYTPIPTGRRRTTGNPTMRFKRINPDDIFASLSDEEKQELLSMRSQMTKVMQEWCLPKLVCELHASIGDRTSSLSEAEQGLLSIIKETSMNPMGEISKYHFAAHMGQLLANVEGNGCHNFYPNCPLSGTKVLQMVKRVRIK